MQHPAPPPGRGGRPHDDQDKQQPQSGCAVLASGAAAVGQLQQPLFRYWIDELLWSQGRVATITIEEVLDQMGGQRTGGPHKPTPKPLLPASPAAANCPQQLLQHLKLSDPAQLAQQQLRKLSMALGAGSGQQPSAATAAAVSRSSSEATMPSSRNSSADSLDAAIAAAEGVLPPAHSSPAQQRSSPRPAPTAPTTAAAADAATATAAAAAAAAAASGSSDSLSSESDPSLPAAAGGGGSSGSSGGQLGPTKRPDDHLLGYHHVRQWDILWTKSVYAIRAARQLQQGQIVSAIAGLNCLSMKKRMVQTLRMALGAHAFRLVPLSFCMPEDLPAWQTWLSSPQGSAADTGLWMLKTGQDAGRGLKLVRTQQALQVAVRPPKNPSKPQTHIKVAQQYITNPLLIQGRKFHLRLWLLVTSHQPLRAYLHSQGLVLFSSEPYDTRRPLEGAGVRPAVGHVTNYARNEDSWVWDLPQLQQQLGQGAWDALWHQMQVSSALTAATVLGPLRAAHRWLQPSVSNYGFQMLGLDYLIDESLHPWLLEVNSAPSIMAVHSDPATCNLIRSTKQAMLGDMLAMVQHRVLGSSGSSGGSGGSGGSGSSSSASGSGRAGPSALSWQEELAAEMANRGGFEPVMGLFPIDQAGSSGAGKGYNIPWQDVDRQLHRLMQQQYQ